MISEVLKYFATVLQAMFHCIFNLFHLPIQVKVRCNFPLRDVTLFLLLIATLILRRHFLLIPNINMHAHAHGKHSNMSNISISIMIVNVSSPTLYRRNMHFLRSFLYAYLPIIFSFSTRLRNHRCSLYSELCSTIYTYKTLSRCYMHII